MLRAVGVTVVAATALAGVSPGPRTVRPARPADVAPRAGVAAMTQEWRVVALDPSTRSGLLLVIDQTGTTTGAQLFYWPHVPQDGVSQVFHDLGAPTGSSGVAVRGISLARTGSGWSLHLDQGTVRLTLAMTAARAGPTATGWPVGQVSGPGVVPFASTFDWSVPVAAAAANGVIAYDGKQVDLTGWRGYVDHTWGRFDFGLGYMQHWDWAVVETSGEAWIVDGFETGPGLSQWRHHDDQWRGVLVHVRPRGTSACRAHASRGGWAEHYQGVEGYVYPQTLTASCGGMHVTFSRLRNVSDVETGAALSSARTSAGGYGLFDELVLIAP